MMVARGCAVAAILRPPCKGVRFRPSVALSGSEGSPTPLWRSLILPRIAGVDHRPM